MFQYQRLRRVLSSILPTHTGNKIQAKTRRRMIETILMCLLMQTPTPSDMNEYISCRRVVEKVQHVVEWHDVIAE